MEIESTLGQFAYISKVNSSQIIFGFSDFKSLHDEDAMSQVHCSIESDGSLSYKVECDKVKEFLSHLDLEESEKIKEFIKG